MHIGLVPSPGPERPAPVLTRLKSSWCNLASKFSGSVGWNGDFADHVCEMHAYVYTATVRGTLGGPQELKIGLTLHPNPSQM